MLEFVIGTVFSHIVAAATILFWIHKSMKISNSVFIKISLFEEEKCFFCSVLICRNNFYTSKSIDLKFTGALVFWHVEKNCGKPLELKHWNSCNIQMPSLPPFLFGARCLPSLLCPLGFSGKHPGRPNGFPEHGGAERMYRSFYFLRFFFHYLE